MRKCNFLMKMWLHESYVYQIIVDTCLVEEIWFTPKEEIERWEREESFRS